MQPEKEEFISMSDARANLTEVMNKALYQSKATVLTTRGKPRAVVVNYEWYIKMMYGDETESYNESKDNESA